MNDNDNTHNSKDKYLSLIENKINDSYKSNDDKNEDEELNNLMNLIKIDDDTDYKKIFENNIFYLINKNKDDYIFDFKKQKGVSILNFILNNISTENMFRKKKDDKSYLNEIKEDKKKIKIKQIMK